MKEDIIRMAREAGLHSAVLLHLYGGREAALTDSECDELRRLERFFHAAYAAGAAAERNAILQMSREQWFKTQADFEEAISARECT